MTFQLPSRTFRVSCISPRATPLIKPTFFSNKTVFPFESFTLYVTDPTRGRRSGKKQRARNFTKKIKIKVLTIPATKRDCVKVNVLRNFAKSKILQGFNQVEINTRSLLLF